MNRSRDSLEQILLRDTLEYARENVPFYSELIAPSHRVTDPAETIRALPTIDKETLEARHSEFLSRNAELSHPLFTSGTTGEPAVHWTSRAERSAMKQLASRIAGRQNENTRPGMRLHFRQVNHGITPEEPGPNVIQIPAIADEHIYSFAHRLLAEGNAGKSQMRHITGNAWIIMDFTLFLMNQGVEPRTLNVETLVTSGTYLPVSLRRQLSSVWESEIVSVYSLTEFAASAAPECSSCGRHRFVLPTVYPEVLDPASGNEVHSGVGELVLSGLHPFYSTRTLLRYRTGDLVHVDRAEDCGAEGLEFRYLGRLKHSAWFMTDSGRRWLGSAEIGDVLASFPWVRRFEGFLARSQPSRHNGAIGAPRATIEQSEDGRTIDLSISCTFAPRWFPESASEYLAEVRRRLLSRSEELSEAVRASNVQVRITLVDDDLPPISV